MVYLIVELRWVLLAAAALGVVTGFAARRAGMSSRKGATRVGGKQ